MLIRGTLKGPPPCLAQYHPQPYFLQPHIILKTLAYRLNTLYLTQSKQN